MYIYLTLQCSIKYSTGIYIHTLHSNTWAHGLCFTDWKDGDQRKAHKWSPLIAHAGDTPPSFKATPLPDARTHSAARVVTDLT